MVSRAIGIQVAPLYEYVKRSSGMRSALWFIVCAVHTDGGAGSGGSSIELDVGSGERVILEAHPSLESYWSGNTTLAGVDGSSICEKSTGFVDGVQLSRS